MSLHCSSLSHAHAGRGNVERLGCRWMLGTLQARLKAMDILSCRPQLRRVACAVWGANFVHTVLTERIEPSSSSSDELNAWTRLCLSAVGCGGTVLVYVTRNTLRIWALITTGVVFGYGCGACWCQVWSVGCVL
jgi:hypothetical protein